MQAQALLHPDAIPYDVLRRGFTFDGKRVPLLGPQGIFKPAVLEDGMALTITTAPAVAGRERPYEDAFDEDGLLLYKYRGTDPKHHENVGLRKAMQTQTPLIYLHGLVPGQYHAEWPVFVVGDDPATLTFRVAADEPSALLQRTENVADLEVRRKYVTGLVRRRLHQAGFRMRVIEAYRRTCAVCRLKHIELLDAAHILPDGHPRGEPVIPNGLALCKLHHAAFDQNIIGIRPDFIIEIGEKILAEIDGPMLVHGLQGFHGAKIHVPRSQKNKPSSEFLEERYELFRAAG
ncbi:MAG TPA: HNH endonuclease [Actinomycetota bacterium]|nr:HNH endonuclease [Actinomycetota bacterium]